MASKTFGRCGFLNLYKPPGMTSSQCVQKLKRVLNLGRKTKIGHGGTLDPSAVGVLPIGIGSCTRLFQYLDKSKMYVSDFDFGKTSTTDDADGTISTSEPVPWLQKEVVESLLVSKFQGTILQKPPLVSARRVKGKRLYEMHFEGTDMSDLPIPSQEVHVDKIEMLDWQEGAYPRARVAVHCSTGTYIRSIARDLGELIMSTKNKNEAIGALVSFIERRKSGPFSIETALTFEQLERDIDNDSLNLIEPDVALLHLLPLIFTSDQEDFFYEGRRFTCDIDEIHDPRTLEGAQSWAIGSKTPVRIYGERPDGQVFLGIMEIWKLNAARVEFRPKITFNH